MEFIIKFFNNPNQKDHFKLKVDENFIKQGLFDAIVENIENNLQLRQEEFIILSKNGIKINEKSLITNGQMIQLCPTILGGKGGFGSLLRAFGKQMQQSTNKEACRDLTGRRIRHVNNEKKLKDFLENQNETARLKEEKKREKIEARKKKRENLEKSHHLFVDPNYDKQKEKIAQDLDEAISKACTTKKDIKKSDAEKSDDKTSAEDKVSNDDKTSDVDNNTKANKSEKGVSTKDINKKEVPVSSGKKKLYSDWMGCDDLDVSSSDEDESDEDTKPATKKLKM